MRLTTVPSVRRLEPADLAWATALLLAASGRLGWGGLRRLRHHLRAAAWLRAQTVNPGAHHYLLALAAMQATAAPTTSIRRAPSSCLFPAAGVSAGGAVLRRPRSPGTYYLGLLRTEL